MGFSHVVASTSSTLLLFCVLLSATHFPSARARSLSVQHHAPLIRDHDTLKYTSERGRTPLNIHRTSLLPPPPPISITNSTNAGNETKIEVCLDCIEFMDNNLNALIEIVTKIGVTDTCAKICSSLNSTVDIDACNTLCDTIGSDKFWQVFVSAGINPIYACELVDACVAGTIPIVNFTTATISPAYGPPGTTFVFQVQFTIINETGVGETAFVVYYPTNNDHELGYVSQQIFADYTPGNYEASLTFPTNSSFNVGKYLLMFDLCSGACGQDPNPYDFVTEELTFNITTKMTHQEPPMIHLLSGATAGLIADGIMHPIDTIRARLQTQSRQNQQYKNTGHALLSIIKQEGPMALFKGFPIVVTATIPAHALYFSGYELSKILLYPNTPQKDKGAVVHFLSGFIADLCGALVWTPMDIIKQRLQVQRNTGVGQPKETVPRYKGSYDAFKTIIKVDGPLGLYKGFFTALATYGPLVGIYFAMYEKLKITAAEMRNMSVQELPFYYHIASGASAGAFAAAVTCPLDVVKTRIQVLSRDNPHAYRNAYQAVKTILQEEGLKGFRKGIGARILWIAPGNAITISTNNANGFTKMLSKYDEAMVVSTRVQNRNTEIKLIIPICESMWA